MTGGESHEKSRNPFIRNPGFYDPSPVGEGQGGVVISS